MLHYHQLHLYILHSSIMFEEENPFVLFIFTRNSRWYRSYSDTWSFCTRSSGMNTFWGPKGFQDRIYRHSILNFIKKNLNSAFVMETKGRFLNLKVTGQLFFSFFFNVNRHISDFLFKRLGGPSYYVADSLFGWRWSRVSWFSNGILRIRIIMDRLFSFFLELWNFFCILYIIK